MRTALTVLFSFVLVAAAPPAVRLDAHGDPLPPGAVMRLGSSRLRHHCEPFGSVAIGADGFQIATLGHDLRVWRRDTGTPLTSFEPGERYSSALAFSPDGRSVLTGTSRKQGDAVVWVWDRETGRRRSLGADGGHSGTVRHFSFSRDGKTLAVFCSSLNEERVHLHDYPSGKSRGVLNLDDLEYAAVGMSFDPRGRLVLPYEGVRLFDVTRRREIGRLGGKVHVYSFALSPDGKTAAIQVGDATVNLDRGTVRLVSLDTGRTTTGARGPRASGMGFSRDGKELFCAAYDGPVVALDAKTGERRRVVVPGDGVQRPSAAFSADGRWLARSDFQTVVVNDLRTGRPSAAFDDHRDGTPAEAAPSPDGKLAATRSKTEVRIWDLKSSKTLRRIGGGRFVPGLRWSPDGKLVAVGRPGKFCWYDAATGKLVREIPLPMAVKRTQARLSADGRRVVVADFDPDQERLLSAWVLSGADGKELARFSPPAERRSVEVGEGGQRVIDGGEGDNVLWRLSAGKKHVTFEVRGLQDKTLWTRNVAEPGADCRLFAPGWVVLVSPAGVEAWDVSRGRPCGPVMNVNVEQGACIKPVALSPDGRTLVLAQVLPTGDFATIARLLLCEAASGQVRARLPLLPACDSAAFTRDGRRLLTASDGTALVWDVDELGARSLSGREWDDLAGDGRAGFVAVSSLVVHPAEAVAMLSAKLSPSRIDAKQVRRWLDQLDDESFEARNDAEKALAALGDHVEEDLRGEAAKAPPPEVRARLARLLKSIDAGTPDARRRTRAVEALERIGSPGAARLLRRLTEGHPGARQTRQAAEALARLKERT